MALKKIGFLADTHSNKPDGSDLPDATLKAFKGVDLIVHLGDIGRKGILDRLGEIAPVMVPDGTGKGYVRVGSKDAPVKVLEAGKFQVGITFNLVQPDKKIAVGKDGAITFPDAPLDDLIKRRFKQPVDVVAFGGTHCGTEQKHEGITFFNPGSPNLPSDGPVGSVAVLDLSKAKPAVKLIRLK